MKIFVCLFFLLSFFFGFVFAAQENFINLFHSKVLETIKHAEEIPGLKVEEFKLIKSEIANTWNDLVEKGILEVSGADRDVRPYFVALQGILEHVLAYEFQKNISSLKGIIHTPLPATPLCTKGEISKDLVDSSIEEDPYRLFTVKARSVILREYLHHGGTLFIAYPYDGLAKRTEEQQKIYKQELQNYSKNLFDWPLKSSTIPIELVGATYFFTDQQNNLFVFSIKITQAKDPQEMGHFAIWFGSINNKFINERVQIILDYVEKNSINAFKKDFFVE